MDTSTLERFNDKWETSTENSWNGEPCWDWTAGVFNGYGDFYDKRTIRAHRSRTPRATNCD